MEWYSIVKFVHVAAVIVWLGGALGLVLLGARANRTNDTVEFGHILQDVALMSARVFVPSALVALVFGLILFFLYGLYGFLWVYIGLAGFAATFGMGIAMLKPRADKIVAQIGREGVTPAVVEQGRDLLRHAQFDMVLLFVIVADMVIKPGFSDWITLVIMALVIIGGAYYFLRDQMMSLTARAMQKA